MARTIPTSVIETPEFLSATSKLMNDEERALLVDYLAYKPRHWRRAKAAVALGGSRQARRWTGGLLPLRCWHAAFRAHRLRQERAG